MGGQAPHDEHVKNTVQGDPVPRFSESGSVPEIFDRWLAEGWPTLEGETDGCPFWSMFKSVTPPSGGTGRAEYPKTR